MTLQRQDKMNKPNGQTLPLVAPGALKFGRGDGFHSALRERVDSYVRSTGRRPRDCVRMYLKTAIVLAWFVGSYASLVLLAGTWWLAVPLAISLGLAMAAV